MTRYAVAAYRVGGDRDGEYDIYFVTCRDIDAAEEFVTNLGTDETELNVVATREVPEDARL